MSHDAANIDAQLKASKIIANIIVTDLATERGPHAETCVTAAARMGGTLLFRTFGLPTTNIPIGAPVLSDIANERGPLLVEVMKTGLAGLGLVVDESKRVRDRPPNTLPLFPSSKHNKNSTKKLRMLPQHMVCSATPQLGPARWPPRCSIIRRVPYSTLPSVSGSLCTVLWKAQKTNPIPTTRAASPAAPVKKSWFKF